MISSSVANLASVSIATVLKHLYQLHRIQITKYTLIETTILTRATEPEQQD